MAGSVKAKTPVVRVIDSENDVDSVRQIYTEEVPPTLLPPTPTSLSLSPSICPPPLSEHYSW